jgi:hypothetical protein
MKKKSREKGLPVSHDHHGQKAKECAAKVRFVGGMCGVAPYPHPQGHALRLLPSAARDSTTLRLVSSPIYARTQSPWHTAMHFPTTTAALLTPNPTTPRRPWPRTRRHRPRLRRSCRLLAAPRRSSSREGTVPTIDPHFPLRFLSRERPRCGGHLDA